jgi:hypothetical protein
MGIVVVRDMGGDRFGYANASRNAVRVPRRVLTANCVNPRESSTFLVARSTRPTEKGKKHGYQFEHLTANLAARIQTTCQGRSRSGPARKSARLPAAKMKSV